MPCECSTFSATRICSSRLAVCAEPEPPWACQVPAVNGRPPEKPLPVLIPQFPPDSHCAIASQFTLYALGAGAGGGASTSGGSTSGAGAGGTFGSKSAGSAAGGTSTGAISGAGVGGTFGSKPTGSGAGGASGAGGTLGSNSWLGATFGSKPTASALAVPAGTVTSVPVIAATMSVLRTFFNR